MQVAGEAGYAKIVQQYRGMLDAELKALEGPTVDTQPPLNAPEQPQAAAGQLPQDLQGQVGGFLGLAVCVWAAGSLFGR